MNKQLFDKINSYITNNSTVAVNYGPHHKGCDISMDKNHFLEDYDFFHDQLSNWWYEDLSDWLISNDAFGENIGVRFFNIDYFLWAEISISCSDYYTDCHHYKEEVITPAIVNAIKVFSRVNENDFNEDLIEFDFYFDGDFQSFLVYYADDLLELDDSTLEVIKLEVCDIIRNWYGGFFGSNRFVFQTSIQIDPGGYFCCTDHASCNLKISCDD